MTKLQETCRALGHRLERIVGPELTPEQQALRTAENYRSLMEGHLAESTRYQALLFHSWKCIREQAKGLKRQAMKIKRLRKQIAEVEQELFDSARGKRPLPDAEQCRKWAIRLGVPDKWKGA